MRTGQRNREGTLWRPLGRICHKALAFVFTKIYPDHPKQTPQKIIVAFGDARPSNMMQSLCKRCNEGCATQYIRSERVCEQVHPESLLKSHTDMQPANVFHNMLQQKRSSAWKHIEFESQLRKLQENCYSLCPSDTPLHHYSTFWTDTSKANTIG